jgi:hypothetical protein
MQGKRALKGSSQDGGGLTVSSVFSTYVYEGNGATQNIVNGVDLATEGGMVWIKSRDNNYSNVLFDTERGVTNNIQSDGTVYEQADPDTLTSFNSDGFSIDDDNKVNNGLATYASWTFRKSPKFFDVVKYTGNGVAGREIPHELGCDVGMIIVKKLNSTFNWLVYHRSTNMGYYAYLNFTDAFTGGSNLFWHSAPTSSVFNLGSHTGVNGVGDEYIAYIFAHNETDGLVEGDGKPVIKCGSLIASGNVFVDLGFEPQYVMVKCATATGNWNIIDNIRGAVTSGNDAQLEANTSDAELSSNFVDLSPTGFTYIPNDGTQTYIYMAIARDTTTVPTSSDEVFAIDTSASDEALGASPQVQFYSGFPVDMFMYGSDVTASPTPYSHARLTNGRLRTDSTASETVLSDFFDTNQGYRPITLTPNTDYYGYMWKRAKSFFDVVTYTGDGVPNAGYATFNHNLGVQPEMAWFKRRDTTSEWCVNHKDVGAGYLNLSNSFSNYPVNGFTHNDIFTDLTGGTSAIPEWNFNAVGTTVVAYLFSTLAGVSKVGSYTGNGTTQTIDAGFTTGAKFIIIKRTNSTGDWIMVDSTRGLDNFLELNTTNAQASGSGITVDASGFNVTQNGTTDLNASGGEYIYYCVSEGV